MGNSGCDSKGCKNVSALSDSCSLPTISVVVPVYNGEQTVATCIESLLEQTYPTERYEVIVVENGSTDATSDVISRYPVSLLHSPVRGPAAARNLGLSQSQADIVAFTDADCVAHPRWLAELARLYVDDPDVAGVGGAILAYTHSERTAVERFLDEHPPLINWVSSADQYLPHLLTANASYRRPFLYRAGGFNPHHLAADDVDLSWRLQVEFGAKLAYAPKAVVYHHHRATQGGLARMYRRTGFVEILLDTMFWDAPGFRRRRGYHLRRLFEQSARLPLYLMAAVIRRVRLARGAITPYEAMVPLLALLRESSNIYGKLEGLWATRFMSDAEQALALEPGRMIGRLFSSHKE